MNKFSQNLHLHTRLSDGDMTPEQVIEELINLKIEYCAITDHYCYVSGYNFDTDGYFYNLPRLFDNSATPANLKSYIKLITSLKKKAKQLQKQILRH